jgi:hypothetical protein
VFIHQIYKKAMRKPFLPLAGWCKKKSGEKFGSYSFYLVSL